MIFDFTWEIRDWYRLWKERADFNVNTLRDVTNGRPNENADKLATVHDIHWIQGMEAVLSNFEKEYDSDEPIDEEGFARTFSPWIDTYIRCRLTNTPESFFYAEGIRHCLLEGAPGYLLFRTYKDAIRQIRLPDPDEKWLLPHLNRA